MSYDSTKVKMCWRCKVRMCWGCEKETCRRCNTDDSLGGVVDDRFGQLDTHHTLPTSTSSPYATIPQDYTTVPTGHTPASRHQIPIHDGPTPNRISPGPATSPVSRNTIPRNTPVPQIPALVSAGPPRTPSGHITTSNRLTPVYADPPPTHRDTIPNQTSSSPATRYRDPNLAPPGVAPITPSPTPISQNGQIVSDTTLMFPDYVPVSRNPTPTSRNPTPASRNPTPASRSPTPVPSSPTLEPLGRTQIPQGSAPVSRDSTPIHLNPVPTHPGRTPVSRGPSLSPVSSDYTQKAPDPSIPSNYTQRAPDPSVSSNYAQRAPDPSVSSNYAQKALDPSIPSNYAQRATDPSVSSNYTQGATDPTSLSAKYTQRTLDPASVSPEYTQRPPNPASVSRGSTPIYPDPTPVPVDHTQIAQGPTSGPISQDPIEVSRDPTPTRSVLTPISRNPTPTRSVLTPISRNPNSVPSDPTPVSLGITSTLLPQSPTLISRDPVSGRISPASAPIHPDPTSISRNNTPIHSDHTSMPAGRTQMPQVPTKGPVLQDPALVSQGPTPMHPDPVPVRSDRTQISRGTSSSPVSPVYPQVPSNPAPVSRNPTPIPSGITAMLPDPSPVSRNSNKMPPGHSRIPSGPTQIASSSHSRSQSVASTLTSHSSTSTLVSRDPGSSPKSPGFTSSPLSQSPTSDPESPGFTWSPMSQSSTSSPITPGFAPGTKSQSPVPSPATPSFASTLLSKISSSTLLSKGSSSTLRSGSPQVDTPVFEEAYGLKTIVNGVDPVIDLVAVHGLDGHRERSWTAENGVLWLRDCLPRVVPNARILTFGYDGRTHGSTPLSCQTLHDHAVSLITELCLERKTTNTIKRPIIFIAHSIGGIIVKDALIHSNSANKTNVEDHHSIKTSTYGVLFFGTPHQGTSDLKWKKIFLNAVSIFTNTNSAILKGLMEGSGSLQKQLEQYKHISKEFDTKFFYEALRGGSIVVPKGSAVVPGATDAETFGIHSDHVNMVKYKSTDDGSFRKVSLCLRLMVEEAPKKASENWKLWKRMKTAETNGVQTTFEIPFELEYRRNPRFTGRRNVLQNLHNEIKVRKPTPVVLHGIGGIGKTQVALEYTYSHQRNYDSTFWINATSQKATIFGFRAAAERLISQHAKISHDSKPDYRLIAKILDMTDVVDYESGHISPKEEHDECVVRAVKRWLTKEENRNWLLVFDGVDDLESFQIGNYIPPAPHGTIIMTSRRPECGNFGAALEVMEMLEPDAARLLLKCARLDVNHNDSMTVEIIRKLGGLPIAIVQAGSYISTRKITLQKYRSLFERSFNKILSEKPPDLVWGQGDETVLTTWDVSFTKIKEVDPEAAELLSLCSFLYNGNIWEDMLRRGKMLEEDDTSLSDCLKLLFSYSLIQRRGLDDSFYINPLVHLWAHERLQRQEREQRAREAAVLVGYVVSQTYDKTLDNWKYGSKVMAHVAVVGTNTEKYLNAEMAEKLLIKSFSWLAKFSNNWGWMENAEKLQILVLEANRVFRGKDHTETLTAIANLASIYRNQERMEEVEELQLKVVKERRRVQGKDHPDTLKAMEILASTYKKLGRWSEVGDLQLQLMEAKQKAGGEEYLGAVESMEALVDAYKGQKQWEEVAELQVKIIEAREKVLGKEHPDTLEAMANLAVTCFCQDKFEDAELLEKEVLEIRWRTLGIQHPHTISAKENLVQTYRQLGKDQEVRELEE